MAQTVNANVSSLNAQRNLDRSKELLAVSMQRPSSGLRVNSSKDDATETANLSRAQILQQAGTAMVAQANPLPDQVLTLLRS
jgi:flagellin